MQNVLVTRIKNQAQELLETLNQQGFSTFIEPLFTLEQIKAEPHFTQDLAAVIITSSNAISTLLNFQLKKTVKIFAVGKKTAQKLKESGFDNIAFPKKNSAAALLNLIIKTEKNKIGLILYFHGSITNIDFSAELGLHNFNVKNILSYKTQEVVNFSAELLEFTRHKKFDHILFFSTNGVKTFFKLAKKHNLLEYFASAQLLCLSEKILIEAQKFNSKNSRTFDKFPTLKNFYD